MNITVNIDRGEDRTAWSVAAAILEAFETGASSHAIEAWQGTGGREGFIHHRLNIEITVYGGK